MLYILFYYIFYFHLYYIIYFYIQFIYFIYSVYKAAHLTFMTYSDRIRFWQNFILEIVQIYFWKKSDCILWNLADFILSKWRTGVYLFLNSLNAVLSSTIIFSWKNSVSLSCSTKTFTKPTLNISPISPSLSYSSFSWKNKKF